MKKNESNALHVVTENVALPEILVGETPDQPDETESAAKIDFSGAIPQFRVSGQSKASKEK